MTEILNWILGSIRAYGAWSVFTCVIIESVIVPIPSPLIIMGAGFVLIDPNLDFLQALAPILLQIVLPGAVASTLGAYIGYGIGYGGGKPMGDRREKFLGFSWRDVEALERRFRGGRVNASIFLLRMPIFPLSVITAAAGLLRLPLGQFTLWTFYGALPRCLSAGAWARPIRPWRAASIARRVSFQLCSFSESWRESSGCAPGSEEKSWTED